MGDLQDNLNFYELMGVLLPGFLLTVGVAGGYGLISDDKALLNVSLGGVAVGLVAAYVVGYLLQIPAGWLADLYWKLWGGLPTDWVLDGKGRLLSREMEISLLTEAGVKGRDEQRAWQATTRLWAARVRRLVPSNRLERFLGNYGLGRGVAASALVLEALLQVRHPSVDQFHLPLLGLIAAASLWRMHQSSIDYARELLNCYLSSKGKE